MVQGTLACCFPPSVDPDTRLLVLGSLPGVESLKQQQYYGHPRNQFWRLIGEVIGEDLISLDYPTRLKCLLSHGVGLWDVIAQAIRPGSLDQNIREAVPNGLGVLIETLPALRAIAFNGATAERIGRKHLAGLETPRHKPLSIISLPSSSPANTLSYRLKAFEWNRITEYIV